MFWLVLFVSTAFASVAGIAFSVGHLITSRNRLQRRLPAGARALDASALTAPDTMVALAGEPFKDRSIWPWPETQQGAQTEIGARRLFQPGRRPRSMSLRAYAPSLRAPLLVLLGTALLLARSVDAEVRAHRGSLRRGRGPWAGRLSVAPPVCATRGISTEFSGSFGPVDGLRHRGPDGGGVLRQNPGSAQQAKPSARSQHRIDGGRDARGEKLS